MTVPALFLTCRTLGQYARASAVAVTLVPAELCRVTGKLYASTSLMSYQSTPPGWPERVNSTSVVLPWSASQTQGGDVVLQLRRAQIRAALKFVGTLSTTLAPGARVQFWTPLPPLILG